MEEEFASALRQLGDGDANEGVLGDGTRWWRKKGTEELGEGKMQSWTLVRGVSADGTAEWEEKWWETTDHVEVWRCKLDPPA